MVKKRKWRRLDNAAKIFPPTSSKRDTKVFRLVCELKEEVDPAALQCALDKTMELFPLFRSILKKGLFWHYLEESSLPCTVSEESLPVCAPIYDPYTHNLLFRVTYYKSRINLEIFHALSDGTGTIQFLRTLVYCYLRERYGVSVPQEFNDIHIPQKDIDAFHKYYDRSEPPKKALPRASYRVKGEKRHYSHIGVINGIMSSQRVLEKAHEYNATLSEFLIANFIYAIRDNMAVQDRKRLIKVSVPVNLRQFFPTQTVRNFFGVTSIEYKVNNTLLDFEDILEQVKLSFKNQLTTEYVNGIISKFLVLERNPFLRIVPLIIKIPVLRLSGLMANGRETAAFSNLGRIIMSDEAAEYINLFDVFTSTRRPQICVCSLNDKLTLSLSSPFVSTGIERVFFKRLVDMGIKIQIISNLEQFDS